MNHAYAFLMAASALVPSACFPVAFLHTDTFTYADSLGNLTVSASSGRLDRTQTGKDKLELSGRVSVKSASQGLALDAEYISCVAPAIEGQKGEIQQASARSQVRLSKRTALGTGGGIQETVIRSLRAFMENKPDGNHVTFTGLVEITNFNSAKRQTMRAKGTSAIAVLEPKAKGTGTNGLKSASIAGPVTLVLDAPPRRIGEAPTHIVATGDNLILDNRRGNSTAKLVGHVHLQGNGIGTFSGLQKATMKLNDLNEITGWEVGS
jgi:hypothetical protein